MWFLSSILDRFGLRVGPLLGAFWTPRSAQNRSQNISKLCWGDRPSPDHSRRPQDHPKRPQDPPKDSQEAPRGPQDASKRTPGGPHETLRCPSKPLRCPLEACKFTPKDSKGHQEDPQWTAKHETSHLYWKSCTCTSQIENIAILRKIKHVSCHLRMRSGGMRGAIKFAWPKVAEAC